MGRLGMLQITRGRGLSPAQAAQMVIQWAIPGQEDMMEITTLHCTARHYKTVQHST